MPANHSPGPIVIEVAGEPQGIVVPRDGQFRFLAVKWAAFSVDGRSFETVVAAKAAVASAVLCKDEYHSVAD